MNQNKFESLFSARSNDPGGVSRMSDEDRVKFQEALAGVDWYDGTQRRAIADTIVRKLKDEIRQEDISQFFATVDRFGVHETPEYQYQKGLKAYVHEVGSLAPRSTINQRAITLDTELVSVNVEFELSQLQGGRFGNLANIRNFARQALIGKRNSILWNVLFNSITGTPTLGTNYLQWAETASTIVKKQLLVSGIDYADDRAVDGIQAIVGRRSVLGFIMDLDGYSDKFQEIRDQGGNSVTGGVMMGSFRGIPLVALHQYTDGYDVNTVNASNIMIVSRGTTRLAVTEEVSAMEDIDIDTRTWNMRISEKYGAGVFWASRNVRIAIT